MAAPLLDIPARSPLLGQDHSQPGPVRTVLAGPGAARGRVRHLRRREDQHPGARAYPPEPAGAAWRANAHRAQVRPCGVWAYLAALDVHRVKVFDHCEATTSITMFERLVDQVMRQLPYHEARWVFRIMDNGSSHRGEACVHRLTQAHPRLVLVHAPVHASWLNQIKIYFSIVQRKALTPNDFPCLQAVAERLEGFERYYRVW